MIKHQTKLKLLALLCISVFFSYTVFGQKMVSGTITNKLQEPLLGVNILEAGTSNGTVTDIDGKFELLVQENAQLNISYTGYQSQTISVRSQQTFNIQLSEGALLDEIVVVGYGKEKKSNLTGAVASIDNEALTTVPVANSANLLAGRAPGVITRQNSGLPGGENTQIRIRGFARAPLTLVDGVQMDFSRIDPNDIESITILKDAAAAVYGARAGNGVLLVTTKRGALGKPKIAYNGSFSLQSASQFQEYVNPVQYIELVRESNLLDGNGIDATFTEEDLQRFQNKEPGYEGGDWVDALIKNNAPMHQHNLSVSGGSDNIRYFTSFGYTDQESYFRSRDFDYQRINARSNIDAIINDNLSFNLDLSYRQEETNSSRPITGDGLSGVWTDLSSAQPIFPTVLPDPSVGSPYSGFSQRNPLTLTDRDKIGTWDRIENVFRGRLGLQYKFPFLAGLTARAEMNIQRYDRSIKQFSQTVEMYQYMPETDTYSLEGIQNPVSSVSDNQFRRTQLYPLVSLEYAQTFGNHSLKVLTLAEQITRQFSQFGASRQDLLSTSIPELFVGSTDFQFNGGNSGSDIGRESYVGRLNYGYKDKYLFEATFRADGNVLFSPEKRWGYFPSFSLGWVISEESFFNRGKAVDFLKLRTSFSRLGDDTADGLSGFDYLTGYDLSGIYLLGDNRGFRGIRTRGLVNPLLTWEELTLYNIGLEATFLDGRLTVETELFYRRRDGIIDVNIEDIPSTFGAALPVVNLNSQDNRGIEISAFYQQKIGPVRLDIAPNFTYARAKWIEVKSQEDFEDPDQQRLNELDGQWVSRFIGYRSDGLFMTQEEIEAHEVDQDGNGNTTLRPGDIRYKDLNGDGEINFRDQEVIAHGEGLPEIIVGMNLGVQYKNFRLNALFQGATRFSINIRSSARNMFDNSSTPYSYHYKHRWQPDPENPGVNINPDASLPAATQAPSNNNNRNSDFWVKDVEYIRLKNLNLSYSFPRRWLTGANISSAEIYFAAENIFTITNLGIYSDSFDPEFDNSAVFFRNYPITRSVSFGMRLSL